MKKIKLMLTFTLIIFLTITLFPDQITITKDEIREKDLFLFSKDISINGKVNGSIFMIGGRLIFNGQVSEDIVCIGTNVVIQDSSILEGNLIVFGGTLNRSKSAEIKGDYFYTKLNLKKIESTILPGLFDKRPISTFKIIKLMLWIILALVVFSVFHSNMITGEKILKYNFGRVVYTGIISILLFIILFILFILLSFFLIGIPFMIALVLMLILLILYGRTVLFLFIGSYLGEKLFKKKNSPVLFILLGGLVYGLFKFIPVIGRVGVLLSIIEIGIAILYFLRNKLKKKLSLQTN